MSLAETKVQISLLANTESSSKNSLNIQAPDLVYADSIYTGEGEFTIEASAVDEAVAIGDLGSVKLFFIQVSVADAGVLTFKVNGNTDTEKANPLITYSGGISSLTASNSSTSPVKVRWRAVYV